MLKISQSVNNFSKAASFFQYVIQVIVLQNAAKYGKLVGNYGNFGGAWFGSPSAVFSQEDAQGDFY